MNIFIGNLDYKVTESSLAELFEEYGTISSCKIITDKFTGRSKGFGFVTMEDDDEAKKAIDELNTSKLGNREIVVNEAKPKKENFNRRY
ncbi:MAG: RNA-binding protein [Bacteroidales bacterium]|nr:RNA-binding protein [Bacteroidales bacterium]